MSELRRVGGEMVPHRKPAGRRVLLQYEADLCNAVGITEEEYWYFVDQATAYNGQRAKEYDLVPDVRNDPVTAIVVNLVVGIALTHLSTLLAPKSRQPQQQSAPNQQSLRNVRHKIPLSICHSSGHGSAVNSSLVYISISLRRKTTKRQKTKQ